MNFSIPVYVEQQSEGLGRTFVVKPLFFKVGEVRAEQLGRAMSKLTSQLTTELQTIARFPDQRQFAQAVFAPLTHERVLDITVEIEKKTLRARLLFVEFQALGGRVAFAPAFPDLWFTLARGQELKERAQEFYTTHFRYKKESDSLQFNSGLIESKGKAWIASVDLDLSMKQTLEAPVANFFAAMNESKKPDGGAELNKTGRCLNQLFPDELDRVLFRDNELIALTRILGDTECRSVLLLGPPGVGKTALIHEYVHRAVSAEKKSLGNARKVWLLSPQRLIAGMSYVGQWENRVLAILETASKKQHVLYFDDLVGLFQAGLHSQSQLSVAHLLKRAIERREVRVLAEITPEAFRVLQEIDRTFADMFQVVPLREPPPEQVHRILIRVTQQLEAQHRTRFAADVLPAVIDLQQRYVRDVLFPGKAAAFLKQLAAKYKAGEVSRQTALQEFHHMSGLSVAFLDDRQKLTRKSVVEDLGRKIMGQRAAIEAFADAVCLAKARLSDPQRPIASFLFLGPTGVGKTQCAKALSEYLFGSAEKLIRFDLNEYVDPYSVMKLTGTAREPEGLLTSAIRRQPFSVVLFDEIEKADPGVLDLLLQVLGEGRLTDARGRTANFTNAIIVLTSNLGVREASATMGLKKGTSTSDPSVFIRAAENWFRPEFFNRIDRVLPFDRLGRDDIRKIAELLIKDVFKREGLVRRRCILQIHPVAMERVIDEGYHPTLGARALKRAIERQITRPTAEYLAGFSPDSPTVINLYPAGTGVAVHVQILQHAAQRAGVERLCVSQEYPDLLDGAETGLERLAAALEKRRPRGELSASSIRPEHHIFFAMREHLQRVKLWIQRTREGLAPKKFSRQVRRKIPRAPATGTSGIGDVRAYWSALFATSDLHEYLKSIASEQIGDDEARPHILNILRHAGLLQAQLEESGSRALLVLRPLEGSDAECASLLNLYVELFKFLPGMDAAHITGSAGSGCMIEGPAASRLAEIEAGTHLFFTEQGVLRAVQVLALPLGVEENPDAALTSFVAKRELWRADLAAGRAAPEDDPLLIRPVVRVYDGKRTVLDVRSGAVLSGVLTREAVSDLILARLPILDEFKDLAETR